LNFSGKADEVLALGGVLARKFRWSATRVREATSRFSFIHGTR